ncbi:MAG: hypothetical protein V1889_01880 [archaeon]
MKKSHYLLSALCCLLLLSFASAEFSIDISGLKTKNYNPNEEMTFKIILLENGNPVSKEVTYGITDALEKTKITGKTNSNEPTSFKIEKEFASGIWTITANYQDSQVKRAFTIAENPEVEFLIEGDELIIRNTGNVRYTKTIQIIIGTETNSYAQNIRAGDEKILKLISPDGTYNIQVTDGETSIRKENVHLFGTGNVIGAVDKELVGYTGFAGTSDPTSLEDRPSSLAKLPLALIFIAAIGILIVLVIVERHLSKKKT